MSANPDSMSIFPLKHVGRFEIINSRFLPEKVLEQSDFLACIATYLFSASTQKVRALF